MCNQPGILLPKRKNFLTITTLALWLILSTSLAMAGNNSPKSDDWNYRLDFYLWGASVGGESATGGDIDIKFKDLAKDLEFALMTSLAASKNKWLFEVDVIYLDVEDDGDFDLDPILDLDNVGLQGWIINPFVGYTVLEGKNGYLALLAGARYLYLDLELELRTLPPLPKDKKTFSDSGDIWNGIVGAIGRITISDRWAFPYYIDVGTGDSEITWQVFGGVAYAFKSFELIAGYRYLDWDFEDDSDAFNDLNLSGPMLGARFRF
jgi:hypothetical protein